MLMTGTVKGFNRSIGAGFIRTDEGGNVLFLRIAASGLEPDRIREGLRVRLDVSQGLYGQSARRVEADGPQGS